MTTPITIPPGGLRTYYLGVAGQLQTLRMPQDNVTVNLGRAEVEHALISGGSAVTHRRDTRRRWTLTFPGLTPDTADTLTGFYVGVFGDGPFCFVDPAWRNALHVHASTFGMVTRAITGWAASVSAQALSFDTSIASTSPTCGVMRWAGAQNGSQVGLGTWSGSKFVPDTAKAPPYLPAQATAIQLRARAVSGTPSLSLRGQCVAADGTVANTTTSTATLNSAGWSTLTVSVPTGLTAAYVLPNLLCNTNNAVMQFTTPLVQYGKTSPDPWVIGLGIPRVVIPAGLSGQYTIMWARDHGLTLAET